MNPKSFERFLDERSISGNTRLNYFGSWKRVRPDLHQDLVQRFKELEGKYKFSTIQLDKKIIKAFLRWKGEAERVDWIRVKRYDVESEVLNAVIGDDEVARLLGACDHPRDKALIAVCWESGVRLGELLSMQLRHCEETSYGFKWVVKGKTGARSIWLIRSAPLLRIWLSVHPRREDKSSFLWVRRGRRGKGHLHRVHAQTILKRAARDAGLQRRVWWHMFRHNAATRDARRGMTENQLCLKYGWAKNSLMPRTYVHLFGSDIEQTVLANEGIQEVTRRIDDGLLKPKVCLGCQHVNPSDATHCFKCQLPLDKGAAEQKIKEQDSFKEAAELMTKPWFREHMAKLKRKYEESL